jgi:hypothetical protein
LSAARASPIWDPSISSIDSIIIDKKIKFLVVQKLKLTNARQKANRILKGSRDGAIK